MTTESGWNRETGLAGLAGDLYLAAGNLRRCQQHRDESALQLKDAERQLADAHERLEKATADLQEAVAGGAE